MRLTYVVAWSPGARGAPILFGGRPPIPPATARIAPFAWSLTRGPRHTSANDRVVKLGKHRTLAHSTKVPSKSGMASRDPALTALNKKINAITAELKKTETHVMRTFGKDTIYGLHGRIGGKNAEFIDVKNEVILSSEAYVALWLRGLMRVASGRPQIASDAYWSLVYLMQQDSVVREYVRLFLQRTYLRESGSLARRRPSREDSEIWIGENKAIYGLLVTPCLREGEWTNDKSEIRHFPKDYFTIGHVLESGLVVPGDPDRMSFADLDQYLTFFKQTLVRATGSPHQIRIAQMYVDFVRNSSEPEKVPLLIPEFRYMGREAKHLYRLDFAVIDPHTMQKIGFELSPWSTHGKLTGTKSKTQNEINQEASDNFDKEMSKHKAYFRKHQVYTMIYTDVDLASPESIFADIERYLQPRSVARQLEIHAFDEFERFGR